MANSLNTPKVHETKESLRWLPWSAMFSIDYEKSNAVKKNKKYQATMEQDLQSYQQHLEATSN